MKYKKFNITNKLIYKQKINIYEIKYRLSPPVQRYKDLYKILKGYGAKKTGFTSTWVIKATHETIVHLKRNLKNCLDQNDALSIVELS